MEKNLDFLGRAIEIDLKKIPILVIAQIGDAVFELYIRNCLIQEKPFNAFQFHNLTVKYVKATAQAKALDYLEDYLTIAEQQIIKRGKNAKSKHLNKNISWNIYAKSTALETLIGYLYLKMYDNRLKYIMEKIKKFLN